MRVTSAGADRHVSVDRGAAAARCEVVSACPGGSTSRVMEFAAYVAVTLPAVHGEIGASHDRGKIGRAAGEPLRRALARGARRSTVAMPRVRVSGRPRPLRSRRQRLTSAGTRASRVCGTRSGTQTIVLFLALPAEELPWALTFVRKPVDVAMLHTLISAAWQRKHEGLSPKNLNRLELARQLVGLGLAAFGASCLLVVRPAVLVATHFQATAANREDSQTELPIMRCRIFSAKVPRPETQLPAAVRSRRQAPSVGLSKCASSAGAGVTPAIE